MRTIQVPLSKEVSIMLPFRTLEDETRFWTGFYREVLVSAKRELSKLNQPSLQRSRRGRPRGSKNKPKRVYEQVIKPGGI